VQKNLKRVAFNDDSCVFGES